MSIGNTCPEGQGGAGGRPVSPASSLCALRPGRATRVPHAGLLGDGGATSGRRASRGWKAFLEMCLSVWQPSVCPAHARERSSVTYLVRLDQRPHKPATPAAAVPGTRPGRAGDVGDAGLRACLPGCHPQPCRLPWEGAQPAASTCSLGPFSGGGEPGCAPVSGTPSLGPRALARTAGTRESAAHGRACLTPSPGFSRRHRQRAPEELPEGPADRLAVGGLRCHLLWCSRGDFSPSSVPSPRALQRSL